MASKKSRKVCRILWAGHSFMGSMVELLGGGSRGRRAGVSGSADVSAGGDRWVGESVPDQTGPRPRIYFPPQKRVDFLRLFAHSLHRKFSGGLGLGSRSRLFFGFGGEKKVFSRRGRARQRRRAWACENNVPFTSRGPPPPSMRRTPAQKLTSYRTNPRLESVISLLPLRLERFNQRW